MKLDAGVRLLHYRLDEKIGQGGMGEVWRATDTTLDRRVAIKLLPDPFAADPERLARFEREAKLLASLNHPHIASVFGLHEWNGRRFLAMELAPGETLMARLGRGPVPVEEALALALQISEGLEAAHVQGVIHRDLKPSNIVVDPDGGVKILDFGLAKTLGPDPASGGSSLLATVTTPATQSGVILGTAAYMCPEQARGRPVDKRSDIWAFGVVLWEMLTGRRLFPGETVSDTLAAVLKEDPDFDALPSTTPASVEALLRRCLEKDPKKRLRDIGEARILLARVIASPDAAAEPRGGRPASAEGAPARGIRPAAVAGLLVAGVLLGAAAAWLLKPPAGADPATRPTSHLSIELPADEPIGTRLSRPVAISPDGRRIAYVGVSQGTSHIFTRALASDAFEEIPGTENAIDPFFSPDGARLGFLDSATFTLKSITLGGVAPTQLFEGNALIGSLWSPGGYIYYTPVTPGGGGKHMSLARIPAAGGAVEDLTPPGEGDKEMHLWPDLLPGGGTLLYSAVQGLDFGKSEIRAFDLETRREKVLLPGAQLARYVPTGHLVYLQGRTILATRFDPLRVEIRGNPTAVLTNVLTNPDSGSAAFAFSRNGTLVYVSGTASPTLTAVVGADREGHTRRLIPESRDYLDLAVSPGGDEVAVAVQDKPGSHDVWVHDLRRGTFERLSEDGTGIDPVWSPDGRWIYFASLVGADRGAIMRARADGTGRPETIRVLPAMVRITGVSPDGRWLMLDRVERTHGDLVLLPLEDDGEVVPFLATEANEADGRFSSDGRFVAYLSDQSGHAEAYIRAFPGPGPAWRIPGRNAEAIAWASGGRELLVLEGVDVMAVDLGRGPDLRPGAPRKLFSFEGAPRSVGGLGRPVLDVLPDGTIVSIRPAGGASGLRRIDVVLNWFGELERQVP